MLLLTVGQIDHLVAVDHLHGGVSQPRATLGEHVSKTNISIAPCNLLKLASVQTLLDPFNDGAEKFVINLFC